MTEHAAMQGTYSDLKTIRSRKVVQMVVEFPIEAGAKLVETFGFPNPGEETWVAIARLDKTVAKTEPTAGEKAKRHFEVVMHDNDFEMWFRQNVRSDDRTGIRELVKLELGMTSANQLLTHPDGWNRLYNEFKYRDSVR